MSKIVRNASRETVMAWKNDVSTARLVRREFFSEILAQEEAESSLKHWNGQPQVNHRKGILYLGDSVEDMKFK